MGLGQPPDLYVEHERYSERKNTQKSWKYHIHRRWKLGVDGQKVGHSVYGSIRWQIDLELIKTLRLKLKMKDRFEKLNLEGCLHSDWNLGRPRKFCGCQYTGQKLGLV